MNRSMDTWLSKMQTRNAAPTVGMEPESQSMAGSKEMSGLQNVFSTKRLAAQIARKARRSSSATKPEEIRGLKDAWEAHRRVFDLDGDGCLDVEELIIVLERCHLFNDIFKPGKVRDYFKSLHNGEGVEDITWLEFKKTLQWVADMRCMQLETIVNRVIILSKRFCDEKMSMRRRLEVTFDSYSIKNPEHMCAFEFGNLCRKLKLRISMGDVFLLFSCIPGGVQGKGVDYEGFIGLIRQVGDLLKMDEDIYEAFAAAVSFLDNDRMTITRVKVRMRQAAATIMGANWMKFFEEIDTDHNAVLDWDEFLLMCRTRLHLNEKESHLRILFERIDVDGSDKVSLQEIIKFVAAD